MKLMMISGGFFGFVMSIGFGLNQEDISWPAVIGRACVVALIAGWLLRWWSFIWLQSLQVANQQRWETAKLEAERRAAAEASPAPAQSIAATHKP